MPWIILTTITLCLNVMQTIAVFSIGVWGHGVGNLIGLLIFCYSWVVVWSHRSHVWKIVALHPNSQEGAAGESRRRSD